jgi:uncharacterized protein (DUF4213/DUF364 family)
MSISSEYIKIVEETSDVINLPLIKDIIVPPANSESKKANFSAIVLDDSTIGLIFINLNSAVKQKFKSEDFSRLKNISILQLARSFNSKDLFEKSLGLGCINAISQFIFKKANFNLNFTSDSLGLLNIKASDIIGMVGYFPPLVKLIEKIGSKLIIIEKKEELVQETESWSITLEPSGLKKCNKILITGTTVLNETIDDILQYCTNVTQASIIGPTASFLPDPVFERGINMLGGAFVVDSDSLIRSIQENIKWGKSVEKYVIQRNNYPGYEELLSRLIKKSSLL